MYTPISLLEDNQTYEQTFLVEEIEFNKNMRTKQDKAFARIKLIDVTGEIEGVVWDYRNDLLEKGKYYTMKVETRPYNGRVEFHSQASAVLPSSTPANLHDYVRCVSHHLLLSYAGEVEEFLSTLDDPVYQNIIGTAMGGGLLEHLSEAPYGASGPMAYRGGLLVHVVHSMRLASVAIQQAKEMELPFNSSLVMAGCALRNIGWRVTTDFSKDTLTPLDSHKMLGIYPAGLLYISDIIDNCKQATEISIPTEKTQALINVCNKQADILTLEGKIVSCADNMADLLDFSVARLQKKQNGNWNDELFTGHLS